MNTNTNPDALPNPTEIKAIITSLTQLEHELIIEGMLENPMRDGRDIGDIQLWNSVIETEHVVGRQVSGVVSSLVKKGLIGTNHESVWFTVAGVAVATELEKLGYDGDLDEILGPGAQAPVEVTALEADLLINIVENDNAMSFPGMNPGELLEAKSGLILKGLIIPSTDEDPRDRLYMATKLGMSTYFIATEAEREALEIEDQKRRDAQAPAFEAEVIPTTLDGFRDKWEAEAADQIAEPAVIAEPASLLDIVESSMAVPDGADPIVDRIRARRQAEAEAAVLRYEFFAIGTIPMHIKNYFGAIRMEIDELVPVIGEAGRTAGFFFKIVDRIGAAISHFAERETFIFTRERVGPMGRILAQSYAMNLFVRRVGEKVRMREIAERGQYLLLERSGEYGIGFYVGENAKGYEVEYLTLDPCDDKPKRFTVSYVGRGDGWRVVSVLAPVASIGHFEQIVAYMVGLDAEAPKA